MVGGCRRVDSACGNEANACRLQGGRRAGARSEARRSASRNMWLRTGRALRRRSNWRSGSPPCDAEQLRRVAGAPAYRPVRSRASDGEPDEGGRYERRREDANSRFPANNAVPRCPIASWGCRCGPSISGINAQGPRRPCAGRQVRSLSNWSTRWFSPRTHLRCRRALLDKKSAAFRDYTHARETFAIGQLRAHAPASEDLITLETEQCARVPAKVRSWLTTSSRERSKSIADIGADRILVLAAEQQYKRLRNRREIYCHNSVGPSHYLVIWKRKQRGCRDDSIKTFQFRDEVRSMQ